MLKKGGTAIFTFTDAAVSQVFSYVQPTLPVGYTPANPFTLNYTLGSPTQLPDGFYNVIATADCRRRKFLK